MSGAVEEIWHVDQSEAMVLADAGWRLVGDGRPYGLGHRSVLMARPLPAPGGASGVAFPPSPGLADGQSDLSREGGGGEAA